MMCLYNKVFSSLKAVLFCFERLRHTCERSRGHQLSLAAARVHNVLLDQVASDLHHRVEGTLQDLLRPVADQLTRRLRHFLLVGLDQLRQLGLQTKRNKRKWELLNASLINFLIICRASLLPFSYTESFKLFIFSEFLFYLVKRPKMLHYSMLQKE